MGDIITPTTYLFVDTETTGFPKKGGFIQDGQARVCQLACLFTDFYGKKLGEFSCLIKPDNWTISENANKIHGITDQMCLEHGIPAAHALNVLGQFASLTSHTIAHNEEFDRGMLDIEYAYATGMESFTELSPFYCTMKQNMHHFGKWPKLAVALEFFTGRVLGDKAHDAMNDVIACRDIFFASRDRIES